VLVFPSACPSTLRRALLTSSISRIARAVHWPAKSWTLWLPQLPNRRIRLLGDGGYATKECLRTLPATVHVVSRLLVTGKLYDLPPKLTQARRGRPPKKGPLLGSPKTLARKRHGWQPHPTEAGTLVRPGMACGTRCCLGRRCGWSWSVALRLCEPDRPASISRPRSSRLSSRLTSR